MESRSRKAVPGANFRDVELRPDHGLKKDEENGVLRGHTNGDPNLHSQRRDEWSTWSSPFDAMANIKRFALLRNVIGILIVFSALLNFGLDIPSRSSSGAILFQSSLGSNSMQSSSVKFVDQNTASGSIEHLPIYWINLDNSLERRRLMEDMFSKLLISSDAVRVSAHDVNKVNSMLDNGLFKFENGITLVPTDDEMTYYHHIRNEYTLVEGAVLLSHLDAIRQAYEDGHELALILEDDAKLSTNFMKSWKKQMELAPEGWKLLQFALISPTVVKHGLSLHHNDPWISWHPDHWAARAYLLNREGMERILSRTHMGVDSLSRDMWKLNGTVTLVADELIYFYTKEAYTSTYPWVDSFYVDTTVQQPDIDYRLPTVTELPKYSESKRPERLLIFGYGHWETLTVAKMELKWLQMDALTVCSMHLQGCDWHVHVVVEDPTAFTKDPQLSRALKDLPGFVNVHLKEPSDSLNKFSVLNAFVDTMDKYDLVLFKDNDHRITGFPWNTFVETKGKAIVAGAIRQTVDDWLVSSQNLTHRIKFPLHDAFYWKEEVLCVWSMKLFETVSPTRSPYLESYFIMMDGDFAKWFFPQVLIPEFLNQKMYWGPDMMWCGAAREWDSERPSCYLLPLVTKYEAPSDPKHVTTITTVGHGAKKGTKETALKAMGHKMLATYDKKDPKFRRWLTDAKVWKYKVNGRKHDWIQYVCKNPPFYVPSCNSFRSCSLETCIDTMINMFGSGHWGKGNKTSIR